MIHVLCLECHGPSSASTTSSGLAGYSPPQSDLFSLGIILLNLITGRNPWKSAAPNDPTFQAYCREPQTFLMSVLPISREVNDALVGSSSPFGSAGGLLSLNPNHRLPGGFAALKQRIRSIREFYSSDVVFEGGMARCGWEVESGPVPDEDSDDEDAHGDFVRGPSEVAQEEENVQVEEMDPSKLEAWQTEDQSETTWQTSNPTSHWSASTDGDSDMVFTHHRRPSLSWTPTPVTPRSHTPTSVHFTISRSRSRPSPSIVFSRPSPSSSGSEYSSGTPEPPLTPPATSVTGRMRLRLNTNLGPNAGTGSGYVQHISPASRTTLVSQSPYTLRSGVSPMATHIVTRSPYARIQPNSPYDSTTILMEANGDEIEEEMRTAIEMDDMGYWHGGDNELIPIPMSAKSPLDEQPLPIPRRDIGYGDSFYDSSTDSESESEDDVRMSMARSYGPEDPLPQVTIQDVGMEFTYTDFTYEYSYSTATNALQDDANNRMSVISASTTIASNGAVDDHNRMSIIETHNRMSIVAMTPTSAVSNENRMSIIPTMPMPSTSGAAPPARPESPILGLSFMPLPSTSTQPMTMPEPSPPIPIPAPTYRDGSHRYHEAEARQEAATYSFLTTDPTATNGDDTSSYAVPSFTLSAYPSSSFAPTTQTLGRNSGYHGPDDSWSFFTSTDLDLDLKLVTPISPAPLPIRPPPTPPTHYPSFSRSSRSRSRRPSRRARERTIERKSRAMAAATGTPTPVTQEEKGPRPRRSASSFLALSLSSMGLGGFKRSREESPAPPPTTTTGNGTKPPPPTPASSNPSSQTQPLQVQGQFSTHWTLSTSVSVCAAREQARSREAGEIRRRRKLRGWFSPGKLFAAVLPSSSS